MKSRPPDMKPVSEEGSPNDEDDGGGKDDGKDDLASENKRIVAPRARFFSKLVARRPCALCLVLLVLNLAAGPVAIAIRGFPDFSDPKVGVESRGDLESEAEHTFRLLVDTRRNTEGCKETFCDEGNKVGDCSITDSIHKTQCPEEKYQKHEVRRRLEGRMGNKRQQPKLPQISSRYPYPYHPRLSALLTRVRASDETAPGTGERENSTISTIGVESSEGLRELPPLRRLLVDGDDDYDDDSEDRVPLTSTYRCPGWTHGRKRLTEDGSSWKYFDIDKGSVGLSYDLRPEEGDLLEPAKLKSMCDTGQAVTSDKKFKDVFCLLDNNDIGSCCPPESLTSFVSYIAGKNEICGVTEEDSRKARQLISDCHEYRESIIDAFQHWTRGMTEAVPSSRTNLKATLSTEAEYVTQVNAELSRVKRTTCKEKFMELAGVYEYLLPSDWKPGDAIKSSNIFFPVIGMNDHEGSFFDLYYDILGPNLETQELQAKGVSIESPNGRFGVFDTDIVVQSKFVFVSLAIIFVLMVLHNGSIFITACALGQIFLSMSLTLFIYQIVIWAPFFTFLNMVSIFILVAIGVDDVFIYFDAWSQSFHNLVEDTPLENRVQWTLHRAGHAMLMTTTTTTVALFTNLVSSVTAVKLFGVFTGLVIAVDYLLMITMLPCIVVLGMQFDQWIEKRNSRFFKCCSSFQICPIRKGEPRKIEQFLSNTFSNLILRYRYPFILVMTAWGIFCFYESMNLPNPENEDLPLWTTSHPLEMWVAEYRLKYSGTALSGSNMVINVNIGYRKEDNGWYFDPTTEGRGTIKYLETNFKAKASQKFYLDVCEQAKQHSLIDPKVRRKNSPEEQNFDILCWPLAFKKWQQGTTSPKKCQQYPVEEKYFEECLYDYLDDTDRWKTRNFYFHMKTKNMSSMHLYIPTTKEWKAVYNYMEDLFAEMSSWAEEQVKKAPAELNEVHWNSTFRYYGLQKALKNGALWASLLALIFGFAALVIMTRHVSVSFLSIIAIFMMLSSLIATMKWMGWSIEINEAGIFSIAVGLSVDFVCHLGHAYCNATYDDSIQMEEREFRLRHALGTVGISVSAAALTTLVGGSVMILSVVLFYNRFGVYLVLSMAWSWLYAFFYFTSLISLWGPKKQPFPRWYHRIRMRLAREKPEEFSKV